MGKMRGVKREERNIWRESIIEEKREKGKRHIVKRHSKNKEEAAGGKSN